MSKYEDSCQYTANTHSADLYVHLHLICLCQNLHSQCFCAVRVKTHHHPAQDEVQSMNSTSNKTVANNEASLHYCMLYVLFWHILHSFVHIISFRYRTPRTLFAAILSQVPKVILGLCVLRQFHTIGCEVPT